MKVKEESEKVGLKLNIQKTKFMASSPISSVQLLSWVWLFVTPWNAARQASLSIINSQSPPNHMSIVSVMPSNHLILCCPLLLLRSIFTSIRVFFNESDWFQIRKGKQYVKAVYCHLSYLTSIQSTSWEMLDWMKYKLESRLLGEKSMTSDDNTLMAESEEVLKSSWWKWKRRVKKLA